MEYVGFDIKCAPEACDILVAELSELGFDSFLENEDGMEAYCPKDLYDQDLVGQLLARYHQMFDIGISEKVIEKKNWNEEWEKNYDPIYIADQIQVRATFHQSMPGYRHEIIIDPKMSFGTGHHATTTMMLQHQLEIDHQGKALFDAGSGTGILAIMAKLLGASKVQANDVDDWCIENAIENRELNGYSDIQFFLGPIATLPLEATSYDIVLANINKNVLLDEIPHYAKLLKHNGLLVLSGFYEGDLEDIKAKCQTQGLEYMSAKTLKEWCSPIFKKH